jgi:Rrf2 family protein
MSYSLAYTQAIALMISIGAQNAIKKIEWVSASSLVETLSIPRPTVVSIVTRLIASGLLESREGKNGGVRLKTTAATISLLDIFEAVERKRPLFNTDLPVNSERNEIVEARRRVIMSFHAAEAKMKEALAEVKLDSLFGCPAVGCQPTG